MKNGMVALLLALLVMVDAAIAGPYDTWSRYRTITLNTTSSGGGANVSGSVSNFPLLVRLTNTNATTGKDVLDSALANGADVRFASSDGQTAYSYQIESWSATAATIWVLVPTVAGNSSTSVRMYWGKVGATTASSGSAVFSPSNGYQAVFHFAETGGAGTAFADAANGYTTTTTGTTNNTTTPILGPNARTFNTGTSGVSNATAITNYAYFTPTTGQSLYNFSGPLTMSAWVRSTITNTSNHAAGDKHILSQNTGGAAGTPRIFFKRRGSFATTGAAYININRYNAGGDTAVNQFGPMVVASEASVWHYITSVWNGSTWTIYRQRVTDAWNTPTITSPPAYTTVDSVTIQTGTGPGAPSGNTNPWFLGGWSSDGTTSGTKTRGWLGELDEVRVANVAMSTDHVRLNFETQKASVTALTLGTTQSNSAPITYTTTAFTYPVGTPIADITPTLNGTVSSITINPALPTGLGINASTGVISGTPSVNAANGTYTVTADFSSPDTTITVDLQIRVTQAVTGFAYGSSSYSLLAGRDTTISAPSFTGQADSIRVSPALPAGLTLNGTTGAITGTPSTGSAAANYTVTAYNPLGNGSQVLNITVVAVPNITGYLSNPATYRVGVPITANTISYTGTASSFSISPSLPSGLNFNTSTGAITGMPLSTSSQANYDVIATGPAGSDTAVLTVTVLPVTEDFNSWSNSRSITLNTSASGANVAGTVTEYPVLVRLGSAESAIFSQALAGGADVRFSKSNTVTRLPYEIVSWDAGAKSAEIWVRVDTVHGNNSSQSIKMYWGKGGAVDSSAGGAVFDTTNGFVGVWHLGGLDSVTARPSSVTGAPSAVPRNFDSRFGSVPGAIGTADKLGSVTGTPDGNNPASGAYLELGRNAAYANNNYSGFRYFSTGISWSSWVYVDTASSAERYWLMTKDSTMANGAHASSDRFAVFRNASTGLASRWGENVAAYQLNDATAYAIGQWHHFSVTKGAGSSVARMYINGAVLPTTLTVTGPQDTAFRNFVFIGRAHDATDYLKGKVDEQRLGKVTRSADWVKLDYESQKSAQTLTNIGLPAPVIAYTPDSLTYRQGTAISTVTPSASGTITGWSVSPSLPNGLSLNPSTGVITGTSTVAAATTRYIFTATNNGADASDSIYITVLAIPAPVVVSPAQNATNVALSPLAVWNTVAGTVTSYQIQGSLDSTFATTPFDTTLADTTAALNDPAFVPATSGSRIHFRVRASNSAGNGDWSTVRSFTTIDAAPSISYTTPQTYTYGSAITTLNVSSVGGPVTSYSITPNLDSATGLTFNTNTGAISGTPDTVSAATNYTVIASGPGGMDTAVVNITVIPAAPAAPTAASATAGNTQGTIAFTGPAFVGGSAITSYTVTSHPGNITGSGSASPITVTGLTNGVSYKFTVTATNIAGTGASSDTSNAVTPATVPGAPSSVSGTAGNTQVTVSFTAPSSNGGSAISVYTVTSSPGGFTGTGATSPIVVTGLTNGTSYTFTVTATNAVGNSAASDTSSAVIPATVPDAPTSPVATPGNAQASVAFTAPVGNGGSALTGYTVTSNPGGFTGTGSASPIVVSSLTNGTSYTFTVMATNAVGTGSPSSASSAVTPFTLPGAPTAVSGTPGDENVTVSWSAPGSNGGSAITSYAATASPGGAFCNSASTSCQVTGLTNGVEYTFTVTATNAAGTGPASSASAGVTPDSASTVPSAPTAVSGVAGNGQVTVSWTASVSDGGEPLMSYTATASPAGAFCTTPNGVTTTCTISGLTNGTPYTFTVVATNSIGNSATSSASTAVTPNAPPDISYSPSTTSFTAFVAITAPTRNSVGGPVTAWSITPALPTGLAFSNSTGQFSGTPTEASAATNYTVIASGPGGADTAVVNITVAANPPVIGYTPSTVTFTVGTVASMTNSSTGGPVSDWSITPALPAGLVFSTTTGNVSGTPTVASASTNYSVVATGTGGTDTAVINVTVLPGNPVISYATPKTFTKTVADTMDVTSMGGTVESYAVTPALPAGLALNTSTGRISGTPTTAAAAANYSVVATNASGMDTAVIIITVQDLTPVIGYTPSTVTFTKSIAATLLKTSTGGAVSAWSITPALPAGLAFSTTTGNISGTPTVAAASANYTVVATNAYGADTAVINVTVLPGTPVISYATPKTFTKTVADTMDVTSTGGTVESYAVTPALPAGLALNTTTGRISGTPTAGSASTPYSVVATNASGMDTAVITITVQDLTPVISYATVVDTFEVGAPVTKNKTSTGGAVTGWSINPALPPGLLFSTTTGNISGTPTTTAASANYTVIATNAYGADTVVLNILVPPVVGILPGAFTFRVSGAEKPYRFSLPAGVQSTELVTMRITDMYGRTVWTHAVRPAGKTAVEVTWNGKTATGRAASAGMYVVRVSVLSQGKNTDYVQKTVTLKSR